MTLETHSNSLQTIEDKMEKSTFLSRVIPGSVIGRIVLFFFLPLFLLLSTLWVALIEPTALSPYLCGLLLFGTVMSCQYKVKGLLISIFAIASVYTFKRTGFALHEIGLCVAAIFDFVVVLLAVAEIRFSLSTLVDESKSHMNQFLAKKQELLEVEESFSKIKEALENEIAAWKEKAEQRKIDLQMAQDRMQLVQSEIEMLTAQKESILNESYEARREAKSQLATLKEQIAEVDRAREEVHRRLESTADIEQEREKLERAYEENEAKIELVKQQYNERFVRQQKEFEEKLQLATEATRSSEELRMLQEELMATKAKLQLASEASNSSEELRMRLVELQEELRLANEKLQLAAEAGSSSKELQMREPTAIDRDYSQLEGLYKQLRSQFEEKSKTLVQTRKQLFNLETRLQAQELQQELDELSGQDENVLSLEKALDQATQECERLEEEVSSLEALISHILSQ